MVVNSVEGVQSNGKWHNNEIYIDCYQYFDDHDHTTNKFRGWLCYQCNSAIGNLGDSIKGLTRALEYLKRAEKIK